MFSPFVSSRWPKNMNEVKWEPLAESPEALPHPQASRSAKPKYFIWLGILLATWSIALACWTIVLILPSPQKPAHTPTTTPTLISHCGNSTAEARALGCTYDTLEQGWVPPDCQDPETLEEYKSFDTWHGFNEEYGQQPISIEEMSERTSGGRYWIAPLDHGVHCVFTLKRFIRFMDRDQAILDPDSADEEVTKSLKGREYHINHCLNLLTHVAMGGSYAQNDDDIQKWSKNRTGFAKCYDKRKAVTS